MFVIVKDENPAGDIKFRIKDSDGNIVQDNCTIEMITQLLQEGTVQNKLLFDSLQGLLNGSVVVQEDGTIVETVGNLIQTTKTDENGNIIEESTQNGIKITKTTSVDSDGNIQIQVVQTEI